MKITLEISERDQRILEHDLLSIENWLRSALDGKIAACRKRMVREGIETLRADTEVKSIPTADDEIIDALMSRPEYKSRAEREFQ